MTVTVYPVDGPPFDLECKGELSLHKAQEIVGGYVEMAYARSGVEQMILNEEGKIDGMKYNQLATILAHVAGMIDPEDCIVGPAIVLTGDNRWT